MISIGDEPTTYLPLYSDQTIVTRASTTRRRKTRDVQGTGYWSFLSWLTIATALALWVNSLLRSDVSKIDGYGLIPALPVEWYAALVLLVVCGAATAVKCPSKTALLGAVVIAIIVVVHATPAVLYGVPRYTWTYKHVGVATTVLDLRTTPRAADIYFDWPGFFTAAGWISKASGVSLTSLAVWAPPFFNLCFAAAVSFVIRGMTKDLRVVWLSVLLFILTNWVGQDYFAPQAYAFAATLVLTGVLLRTTPMNRHTGKPMFGLSRIRRLITRRTGEDEVSIYGAFSELGIGTAARTAAVAVLWLAIVTSHQLSPVFAILTVVAIGAARGCIRWYLLAFMLVTEVAWVAYGYPYLSHHGFVLFNFDPLQSSAPAALELNPVMPGVRVRAYAVDALYFGMFALGVAGGLLRVRWGRIDLAPVLVAVSPATVLALQSYGGEGQLRIYLFSLPYLSFLVAWLVVTLVGHKRIGSRLRGVLVPLLACAVLPAFLLAYYGQEKINHVTADDVAASTWFYHNATRGEWMAYLAPNVASRIDGNYIYYPFRGDADPNLLSDNDFVRAPTADNVLKFMDRLGGSPYLLMTPSEENYLELFGYMTPATYRHLHDQLDATPRLRLVYHSGASSIWRLEPART